MIVLSCKEIIKANPTSIRLELLSVTELNDVNNPMGDFFRNLGISQAELERYIISARTRAGQKERAEQGYYPSKPPVGYINKTVEGKRVAIIDNERAPYIRHAYELYASGDYSLESIMNILNKDGFTYRNKPCNRKMIERIFGEYSIFYLGEFNFSGKRYKGKQEKLISHSLYNAAMKVLHGGVNTRANAQNEFLYRGLIKCGACGRYLTAIRKNGAHNSGIYEYYVCTNNCLRSKKYLKSEFIDEAIKEALNKIQITTNQVNNFKSEIKEVLRIQRDYDEHAKVQTEKKITLLRSRLNKLYDDKIDGTITEDFYIKKRDVWQNELDELLLNLNGIMKSDSEIIKNIELLLEPCQTSYGLYSKLSIKKKREFLKIATWNLTYDGEEIHVELNSALQQLAKIVLLSNSGGNGN